MILSKFDDLRRAKALREGRDISTRAVSRETGIAPNTLGKIKKGLAPDERIYVSTINKLCAYFEVASLADLFEYVPDERRDASGAAEGTT